MPKVRVEPATKPGALFDWLLVKAGAKNDAALAAKLGMAPPALSKMRNGHLGVGAVTILAIHERLDVPVKTIRERLAA